MQSVLIESAACRLASFTVKSMARLHGSNSAASQSFNSCSKVFRCSGFGTRLTGGGIKIWYSVSCRLDPANFDLNLHFTTTQVHPTCYGVLFAVAAAAAQRHVDQLVHELAVLLQQRLCTARHSSTQQLGPAPWSGEGVGGMQCAQEATVQQRPACRRLLAPF